MNTPQTSASERMEIAREVLAAFDDPDADWQPNEADLAETLRALITPPNVAESEEAIVARVLLESVAAWSPQDDDVSDVTNALTLRAVRAGIQAAHETWEPADHPSQEMMLRWLGLDFRDGRREGTLFIPAQYIEKEED